LCTNDRPGGFGIRRAGLALGLGLGLGARGSGLAIVNYLMDIIRITDCGALLVQATMTPAPVARMAGYVPGTSALTTSLDHFAFRAADSGR
jgi:hypothetical protein